MSTGLHVFSEQLSVAQYLTSFFYIFATVGILFAVIGVICIDSGLVRTKHMLTTVVQKFLSGIIGATAFLFIGYSIWNMQYYEAFAIPHPYQTSISEWSLWGTNFTTFAQYIDPAIVPSADMYQIFGGFFFCFAALTTVLIHGAGLERLKSSASYIMSAVVGGIAMPVIAYLTYGSASPLTNNGLHDFVGAYSLYMFVGFWSLVLAWRLGPREGGVQAPGNFSLLSVGVFLLILAIPMFVVGCGFLIPGVGYFGPTMTQSGLGIIFMNIFASLGGGGVMGGILAHLYRKPAYILLGPIAGYVSCSAIFDIASPWESLIVSLIGPVILVLGERVVKAMGIDEPKVAPLTIGPALLSAICAGLIGQGVKQGGFMGITEGKFAFQHATVSLKMQCIGIAAVSLLTLIMAFIVIYTLEKTVGIRISKKSEIEGMDNTYW